MSRFQVLDEPRHRCFSCGTCCTGVFVALDEEEQARMERLAPTVGVEQPVVDGGLRFEAGACVFLDEQDTCRLHRHHGPASKPLTCRQFPFAAIETESGPRAGIDPACTSASRTWRAGPSFVPAEIQATRRPLHPSQHEPEAALLRALAEAPSIAAMLHLLCTGSPGGPALPAGFAGRWITRVQAADLGGFLADPDTGRGLRRALAGVPEALQALDPDAPPPWPTLSAEEEAWSLEVTRRMVYLRRAPLIPVVQGVALLTLGGAVASAWTTPDRFGAALAAWARILRFRRVWQALVPEPATLTWLATGREG